MDLRLSIDPDLAGDWHEAEFQLRLDSAPRLTARAMIRQLADSRLAGPEQEWTWPPRRPVPPEA